MEIRLLGPLQLVRGDSVVPLPRRQQRALLAVLALHAGEVVSTDRLIEDLWGSDAPRSALGSLQNAVYSLRKVLESDALLTEPPGYRLALEPESVDALRFERLLEDARAAPAGTRGALLTDALALWRGPALDDLAFEPFAGVEIARLEGLRLDAEEERLAGELGLGRHDHLVPELESLVAANPLRDRLRGQLMLALYRSGRHAEALEVYRAARLALADERGLDPSPELQRLERAILRQDSALAFREESATELPTAPRERRVISVLAAVPPALDDPELLLASLEALLERTRSTLRQYGGTLERFGPEGLVATFSGRDDNALRAVRSAVELALPAGVSTGEAVLAEAGATGAVVTRASELAHNGGGLRLDARTFALVRDALTAEPEGDAFLVTAVDEAAEGRARRLDLPLIGRVVELERLRNALDETVAERRCRVVTVLGEPGIGKTRLAREVAQRLNENATVLVARCLSHGEGATFLPLLAALRRAEPEQTLRDEPDADLVVERLAALADGSDASSLGESYWAVRRLLEKLAARTPILLVLDDVHWAEPALLDLVDYLAERIAAPLLVLCLARPELERPLGETFTLGPLGADEARAVAEGIAELDEATHARIVELAEGNALYIEQLAVFAFEGGEGLPPTLEAVLSGRLGRLPDAERNVLQRAAVAGREFSRGTVAALTETPIDAQLLSLSRRGLIHAAPEAAPGDDGYRFHHVLLRDAAYETLTKRERAALHERTAAWLDRDGSGDDALVGYHLEQAVLLRRELGEDADSERAGERLGDAAMRAWRQNDTRAAVGLLRRATDLLAGGELRAELLCELAVAELNAGEPGDALVRAAEDAQAMGSERVSARIAVECADLEFRDGGISAAELLETAIGSIDVLTAAGDHRALGRAWLAVIDVHQWACRYSDVAEAARMASESYARASFSPAVVDGVLAGALVFGPVPVRDAIRQCSELLDAAPDRLSEANVTTRLATLAALEGRFGDAQVLCEHARETYDDLGNVPAVNGLWATHALLVERRAGNFAAAATIARASTRYFEARDDNAYASTWAARLGELLYWEEQYEASASSVAAARQQVVAHDVYVQFLWRSTAAKLAARDGRAEEADRLSSEALRLAAASDSPLFLADLWVARAEVLRLVGRASEAGEAAGRARALLGEKGDVAGVAEVHRLLSREKTKSPSGLSV